MTELIHLLYASSATQEMTDDDLVNLLKKAREKTKVSILQVCCYTGAATSCKYWKEKKQWFRNCSKLLVKTQDIIRYQRLSPVR